MIIMPEVAEVEQEDIDLLGITKLQEEVQALSRLIKLQKELLII